MTKSILTFVAVYAVVIGTTSCNGSTVPPPNPVTSAPAGASYQQIERLGRPAVKEATQNFAQHDDTNRTAPWTQPLSSQSLYQSIGTFVTTVAGRRADYATTIQSILIPDEIAVDLSQNTTKAAYLGVETKGATGSAFGGRALSDDVIDADLGVIFGKTLSALGLLSDDGKSSPCLTTDNVSFDPAAHNIVSTFPFVGTPN
jgi:hypothetical protein